MVKMYMERLKSSLSPKKSKGKGKSKAGLAPDPE